MDRPIRGRVRGASGGRLNLGYCMYGHSILTRGRCRYGHEPDPSVMEPAQAVQYRKVERG